MTSKIIFGEMVDYFRQQHSMTMEDLGKAMGKTKSTISRWISGERYPKIEEVEKLAEIFNTDVETILFGANESKGDIVRIYNQLAPPRQTKVYNFAEHQLKEQNQVRLYGSVAANPEALAYADDTYHDDYVTKDVPKNADGALVVAGNSMEPDYKNGSIVFYKKQSNVENGELAVVDVDGDGATFKQVMFDYDSEKIILKSLNKDYPNREIEGNRVRIIGKVLN